MTTSNSTPSPSNWVSRHKIASGVIAFVVAVGTIGAISDSAKKDEAQAAEKPAATATQDPAPANTDELEQLRKQLEATQEELEQAKEELEQAKEDAEAASKEATDAKADADKAEEKADEAAEKAEAKKAANTIPGDGQYEVGVDIKPGTYRTAGPESDMFSNCYWERQRNLSGGFDAILANDNTDGPTTVVIKASDKGFKTSGCQDWARR